MPYKKKAPTKRTKKAVGGALSAAQKRLLGQAQSGAVKKGAGAITKQIVGMTRKYGDQRKAAAAPAKRKAPSTASKNRMARAAIARGVPKATGKKIVAIPKRGPKRGGIAMSKTARANLMRMQREAFKTGKSNPRLEALTKKHGMLVKRGAAQKAMKSQVNKRKAPTVRIGIPKRGKMTPAQRQAAMKKRLQTMRRGRVISTRPPSRMPNKRVAIPRKGPSRLTPAQRRARLLAARRRAATAARKRRAPSRRIKRPVRRPSGLSRAGLALRARRAAAARRARSAGRPTSRRRAPTRRIKRPVRRPSSSRGLSRSALLRARRGRRPVTRGRRGLGRMLRRVSRMR